jgi:dipeptidase E
MELLLLSSSRTPAGYLTDYLPAIKALTGGIKRALFVPFAAVSLPWDEYGAKVGEALAPLGLAVDLIRSAGDVLEAELIVVGGGNTFQLLRECRSRAILEMIHNRVAEEGVRYLGWSAGANLACPTIKTTNDMPVVDPGGFEALGLIPFQINPHYINVSFPGHHGETRDERLTEFARVNPGLPVIGLPEGDWVRVSGSSIELHGPHAAVWFEGEKAPTALRPICAYQSGTWANLAASNAAYEENPIDRTRG